MLEEPKAKPLHAQATKLLQEIEQKAAQRLAHAKQLQEKGQIPESIETLTRRLADQAIGDYDLREGEIHALVIDQIEHALIDRALSRCGGVKTRAADFLGINRNTLNKKVKDLGIEAVD